ncbi:tRNA (cytosine(34)-C(5))-methyltransferase [Kappamyces sp. JEL0680]|nr:tRNA (cytosine(34)-C(5))-methyltransferase [Kappamyces sp. JEL0680]
MGFRKGKKKGQKEGERNSNPRNIDYVEGKLENQDFIDYYAQQELLDENEFAEFLECLSTPLPISWRITGSRQHAVELRDYMKEKVFSKLEGLTVEDVEVKPPKPLGWYPNELAWTFDVGRTIMRRSKEIKELQNFLVSETEIGNISRQEAVSMIPPLLLDVQPGHYVLDMCAAPGSKTAQLLESIVSTSDKIPDGVVIANDADHKRAYMLVHQGKRLQTPCLMVTNHEAQEFPRIWVSNANKGGSYIQFDRILCDVPCSGDGTMRKNKTIFKTWNVNNGNGLHKLQLSILSRACELLKIGGRLVYSTCTFNPIENEAVVGSMLKQANGEPQRVE